MAASSMIASNKALLEMMTGLQGPTDSSGKKKSKGAVEDKIVPIAGPPIKDPGGNVVPTTELARCFSLRVGGKMLFSAALDVRRKKFLYQLNDPAFEPTLKEAVGDKLRGFEPSPHVFA